MNKDITVTIEDRNVFLQATYECIITRRRNSDGSGRTWWEPEVEPFIVKVDMTDKNDNEHEWMYGDNQPVPITRALELYEDKLLTLVAEKVREIVNNPQYEDNPHASDPTD